MTKLSPVVVRIVQKNAEVIDEFGISELPQDLQITAAKALQAIVASVEAKSDENEMDADQIRAIWFNFINKDASLLLQDEATQLVEKINQEEVRDLLQTLVPVIIATLREVTDNEDDDNGEEIEKLWKELVTDINFISKVIGLVRLLF